MYKHKCLLSLNAYVGLALLLFIGVKADESRAFINPMNNKAIDLFMVVDEANAYMNVMQLGLVKTALNNIATDLNPAGSTPYFGVYFYGAAAIVKVMAPFKTSSVNAVKTFLDNKQYTVAAAKPSTLVSALTTINSDCSLHCRVAVPRVTLVISSAPDSSATAIIRQLERDHGMTVVIVGIGSGTNQMVLNELASHPSQFYAIPVQSLYELILASSHIGSVISDVPRLMTINNPSLITAVAGGVYHTVQLNTYPYTTANETIIMFALNCDGCSVYGSLSEPAPTSANTAANTNRRSFYSYSGYPNSMFYFRIPKDTGRFFLSFVGNGASNVNILFDVFSVPSMMEV